MKIIWVTLFLGVFIWSGIKPYDYFTWGLEVAPAIIAFVIIFATDKKFHLTNLAFWLILIHAIILMIGGHYTYAQVPLFNEIAHFLGSERNNYDKLGHFAQGFIPAIVAREIFIRQNIINGKNWLSFLVIVFCLAVSALYELIEWQVALLSGESAEAFLGTQGYIWDTQSDMGLALLGAISALILLSRLHDRQLHKIIHRV